MSKDVKAIAYKNYPLTVTLKEQNYVLRPIQETDALMIINFAKALPPHDLLYMRRDITQETGVKRWLDGVADERIFSIIAENTDGEMLGYSTIHQNDLEWTQHVADLRVTIAEAARGTGLGRLLIREAFNIALALDLDKISAHMTTDQIASRNLFQELGFQNEALLKDHVKDRDGNLHDLLIMAVDVSTFMATREAYGTGG